MGGWRGICGQRLRFSFLGHFVGYGVMMSRYLRKTTGYVGGEFGLCAALARPAGCDGFESVEMVVMLGRYTRSSRWIRID